MQTLLPFDDFKLSALVLTDRLLEQQIEDCITILETLHETNQAKDWNHPIVKAWSGSELQLCEFGFTCLDQWTKRRKYSNWSEEKDRRLEWHLDLAGGGEMTMPPWFGKNEVHLEYQGLLRYLDPNTYEKVFDKVATCSPDRFRYPLDV